MTMAEKHKGNFEGSLESIPAVPISLKKREIAIEEMRHEDRSNRENTELMAIEFLKSANVMKSNLGDGIDDENQNKKAFQCMDIFLGLLRELGVSQEDFLA